MICGRKTVGNSILKHDLCELVTAKMGTAITNYSTRSSTSGKKRFQEFNDSGIISGERFCFNPFRQVIDGHENVLVPSRRWDRSYKIDAPYVKDLAYLNCVLRHFIFLRDFALTLASVTPCDQVMGISVNSQPIETGIKDFLSGVVRMMSPDGSIMASREDINGFLAQSWVEEQAGLTQSSRLHFPWGSMFSRSDTSGSDDYHQILDFLRASHISQLQLADDGGIDDLPIEEIMAWIILVPSLVVGINLEARLLLLLFDYLMGEDLTGLVIFLRGCTTRQYHVFKLSSKLFANMKLNFAGQPMPLLAAMLSQALEGKGAGAAVQAVPPPVPKTIPETRTESDPSSI
ncbi:hypothetical protein Tco_1447424 [Tanacetum coccineum]